MICDHCGVEAPTRYVAFYQNIGLLFVRLSKSVDGRLCKSCIHKYFWSFTSVNLFLGWWGTISFILTPFLLINNIARYCASLFMPRVPVDAERPVLTPEAIEKLQPHLDRIFSQLNEGVKLPDVAQDVAPLAGVTPGQVVLYVYAVVAQMKKSENS